MENEVEWVEEELDMDGKVEAGTSVMVDLEKVVRVGEGALSLLPEHLRGMVEGIGLPEVGEDGVGWPIDGILGAGIYLYIAAMTLVRTGETPSGGMMIGIKGMEELERDGGLDVDDLCMGMDMGGMVVESCPVLDRAMLSAVMSAHAGMLIKHWKVLRARRREKIQ